MAKTINTSESRVGRKGKSLITCFGESMSRRFSKPSLLSSQHTFSPFKLKLKINQDWRPLNHFAVARWNFHEHSAERKSVRSVCWLTVTRNKSGSSLMRHNVECWAMSCGLRKWIVERNAGSQWCMSKVKLNQSRLHANVTRVVPFPTNFR